MSKTEQAVNEDAKEMLAKVADPRYVIIDSKSGQVEGRKYHTYKDCTFLANQPVEEVEVIGEREIRLLGIKACSVCEKRATGGPALKALTEISQLMFEGHLDEGKDHETQAWTILNALKERGIHLMVRKTK